MTRGTGHGETRRHEDAAESAILPFSLLSSPVPPYADRDASRVASCISRFAFSVFSVSERERGGGREGRAFGEIGKSEVRGVSAISCPKARKPEVREGRRVGRLRGDGKGEGEFSLNIGDPRWGLGAWRCRCRCQRHTCVRACVRL